MTADIYLLDTNILVAYFNGDADVKSRVDSASVFLCATVLGELFFGAFKSQRSIANITRLQDFETGSICLNCDSHTAQIYGNIKQLLRTKGHPIPENDIWIAAIALQHDLVLATRDAHFSSIDGLKMEIW